MLRLWHRSQPNQALLAVCPYGQSVAVAQVSLHQNDRARLDRCELLEAQSTEDSDRILAALAPTTAASQRPVISIINPEAYSLVLVEKPEVPPAELRSATRWRVRDLIDFHIDDAVIDVFDVPPRRTGAGPKSMFAVVARTSAVKQRADQLLDAGFNLTVLDIPEMALRNLAVRLPEDKSGVAFIHLAEGGGLITISREGQIYLSRRLARGAEVLLANTDDSVNAEVEGWLDSIVIEVQRSLDYYESHFAQSTVAGVVLAPVPWPVSGVTAYLSSQLGLPTRSMTLEEILDLPQPVDLGTQARCLLAVGAALRTEGSPA